MGIWKGYLLTVITCAFLWGISAQLISDSRRKKLLRLVSGAVLGISLLQPLSGIRLQDFSPIDLPALNSGDYYIAEGEKAAQEARERIITEACEAYILDRARALDTEIMVQIRLNRDLVPVWAELQGESSPEIQAQLQEILTRDLGIPKENQTWIWNQENNSS